MSIGLPRTMEELEEAARLALEGLARHDLNDADFLRHIALDYEYRVPSPVYERLMKIADKLNAAPQTPVSASLGSCAQATAMPEDGQGKCSDPRRSNVPASSEPEPSAGAAP